MFIQIEQGRERERSAALDAVAQAVEVAAAWDAVRPPPTIRYAVPLSARPGAPLLGRGVYASPFLTESGEPVLFAVDSTGRCRGKTIIRGITTWEIAERLLMALLDRLDPQPQLTLVRSA